MGPLTAADIRSSLRNCSRGERTSVHLPDLRAVDWPALDYLGWRDPKAPLRAYLVTSSGAEPVGLALRAPEVPVRRSAQCGLCHTVHQGGVALFAAVRKGRPDRGYSSVGTYVCDDLSCSAHLYAAHRPTRAMPDPEPLLTLRRAELRDRVGRFVQHALAV
jgi:hypothetical protein